VDNDSLGQDETWRTCLQQIMGYALWAGYDLHKFFELVGPKRAGKGIITGVLMGLLGGEHAICSLELEDFGTQFGLEDAIDKRLAIVPEAALPQRGMKKVISRFKAITGGDVVSINRKNWKQVSLRLGIKILLLTNEFLVLPDNSGAIHVRAIPLKFIKSFAGKEDLALADNLVAEYPGILNWALEGVRSLLAAGGRFTLPESSQEELDQLKMESAPLQDFVDDCCMIEARKGCQSQALYAVYEAWHKQNRRGEELLSEEVFAKELKTTVHTIVKNRLGSPGDKQYRSYKIVETDYDDKKKRAPIWLGIVPKPELCMMPLELDDAA